MRVDTLGRSGYMALAPPLGLMFLSIFMAFNTNTAFAQQSHESPINTACGSADSYFAVQKSGAYPETRIDPPKARVYVLIFTRKPWFEPGNPIIRIGLDGQWIDALQGKGFTTFQVDSGQHHLCAEWQPSKRQDARKISFAAFNADAGTHYYFRIRVTLHLAVELEPVNPDEGRFLVSTVSFTEAHRRK